MLRYIIFLIFIAIANGSIFSQTEPLDTDNDGYRNVGNADQLIWISNNPISWNDNFELDNDIDFSVSASLNPTDHDSNPNTPDIILGWSPIGNSIEPFTGVFKGNSHSIDKLFINRINSDTVGFFGYLRNARIENFNLKSAEINSKNYIGIIAGQTWGSEIVDCKVEGTIFGNDYVGGIVGIAKSDLINNCDSDIKIKANRYAGGISGYISSVLSFHGIFNCSSRGDIQSQDDIGGIVGVLDGKMNACFSYCVLEGKDRIGGIIGTNRGIIYNTFFRGSITGNNMLGGIIGFNEGTMHHNTSGAPAVYNSYSITTINSSKEEYGGIIGKDFYGQGGNCYYNTKIIRNNTTNENSSNSLEQMKLKNTFSGWDFNNIWGIDSEINDGYPYLKEFSIVTSVKSENETTSSNFKIFPIPAKNHFNIDTEVLDFNLTVVDNTSKTIYFTSESVKRVETDSFAPGIYYLIFSFNGKSETIKLLIVD